MRLIQSFTQILPGGETSGEEMPGIWELINELFSLELGDYEYIDVSGGGIIQLRWVIIALFCGAMIAAVMSMFNRRVLGQIVHALLDDGCTSHESAKTLAELGYLKNSSVRSALRAGSMLSKTVHCVEEDEYDLAKLQKRGMYELRAAESGEERPLFRSLPYKRDMNTAHFYIPRDMCDAAEVRFDKKGSSRLVTALGIIALFVLMILVLKFLPDMLTLVDNFIGIMGN